MITANQKKIFRECFTKELADITSMYNQEAKDAIVDLAVEIFSVLPDGNKYRYDLVGGKDECAKMLAHLDVNNGELVRDPVDGLETEIAFQKAQLLSLLSLKERLKRELSMFETGDDLRHEFPMLTLRALQSGDIEKEALVNQFRVVVELYYRTRFNVEQMNKRLKSSHELMKSIISILKAVKIGCDARRPTHADTIIAAACEITEEKAHKRRIHILNVERDKNKF